MSDTFDVYTAPYRESHRWVPSTITLGELLDQARAAPEVAGKRDCKVLFPGRLAGPGRRLGERVETARTILPLDFDDVPDDWDPGEVPWRSVAYESHSSGLPGKGKRWRSVVEVDREIAEDDLQRMIPALKARFPGLDTKALSLSQCIYLPARRPGVEALEVRDHRDRPPLPVDEWVAKGEKAAPVLRKHMRGTLADPYGLPGIVGAFNRAYDDLGELIERFELPYENADRGRWKLAGSKSEAGLVEVSQGRFYSHHANDPASDGHSKTAYDLVCAHKFDGDEEAMDKLAEADEQVRAEKVAEATEEFQPVTDDHTSQLDYYDPTDMGDAHVGKRVGREYLATRYLAWGRNRWAKWDGRRWDIKVPDDEVRDAVINALLDIRNKELRRADKLRDEALVRAKGDKNAEDAAWRQHNSRMRELQQLRNVGKIKAATEIARTQVSVRMEAFDGPQTRDFLNVGNGVVNLRTGELLPRDRDLLFTKVADVPYTPGARHPDWDKALTALPDESRTWMQKRAGQAATGHPPSDDVVPFLKGGGENGKTTWLLGLKKALGEFAAPISEKVLTRNPGDHSTEVFDLKGVRLGLLEELPEGNWLTDTNLKKASGTETGMKARAIGQDNVEWDPTHSLMVSTNHDVQLTATDHGTWRRVAEVEFPYTYNGSNPDRPRDGTLRDRIRDGTTGQHEAALAWVVAGAVLSYKQPLTRDDMPAAVHADTKAWELRGNVPGQFAEECLVYDPDSAVRSSEVYGAFREWAAARGHRVPTDKTFWVRVQTASLFHQPGVEKKLARPGHRTVDTWKQVPKGEKARLVLGVAFTVDGREYRERLA